MINIKTIFKQINWVMIASLIFTNTVLNAQSRSSLKGKVIDVVTGEALPGASLMIFGTAIGTAADIYGNYLIKNIPLGESTVRVHYIGYKSVDQKIKTATEEIIEVNFKV